MATLELTSEGVEAGYSDQGFFAFGTTTLHKLDNGEDWEWTVPLIRDQTIHWKISVGGPDVFEAYKEMHWNPEFRSPRIPLIDDYLGRVQARPVGFLRRWDVNEPISLVYNFGNDPSLAAFAMGCIAAKRDLTIYSQGWLWSKGDEDQATPSVPGFMDRGEPAFTLDMPILRIK